MPIYEYRCDNGHTFEAFQSMSDDSLDECEVCGAPAQRVLSAPAIHYKGSGFYTTDYARKGAKKPTSGGESAGGSDSGGGSEGGGGSDSGSKNSGSGSGDSGSKSSDGGRSKDKASSGSSSGSSSSSSGSGS